MLTWILAQVGATQVVESNLPQTPAVAETAVKAVQKANQLSLWDSLWHADPLVKIVILILVAMSVLCWAIIFMKYNQVVKSQKSAKDFWQKFTNTARLSDFAGLKTDRTGTMYEIYVSASQSLGRLKKGPGRLSDWQRDALVQRINITRDEENNKLEQYTSFLATTASIAPFIGLLGTVWGILNAFMEIGMAGSSSLATVGPSIAEALVTTAIGLFAAIPAYASYNYFMGAIGQINKIVDLFTQDFILKSEVE